MSKHTPGPWELSKDKCIRAADGPAFDYIKHHSPWQEDAWDGDAEADANTALMATAPELLGALQSLLIRCSRELAGPEDVHEIDVARRAIAKATGSTP